jgi:hypothetical protein
LYKNLELEEQLLFMTFLLILIFEELIFLKLCHFLSASCKILVRNMSKNKLFHFR